MKNKVMVLGTAYEIIVKKYNEEEAFAEQKIDGYCDGGKRQIVVCDMSTYKGWEKEDALSVELQMKQTLRHEIVHAFFNESGLGSSAGHFEGAWAQCEEMVDWIALQGPKIYAAWLEAGALPDADS